MNTKTIATVLAGLTSTTLSLACDKGGAAASEVPAAATEVPAAATEPKDEAAGERACGNHAEGACGASASADGGEAAATARAFEIAPGKFAEANFQMKKDATVTITFAKGSEDLAWDIHSHDHSGGTKIHDKGTGGGATVEFTAPEDGIFSILWKNGGESASPLDVSITLGDGAQIHSWMPEE